MIRIDKKTLQDQIILLNDQLNKDLTPQERNTIKWTLNLFTNLHDEILDSGLKDIAFYSITPDHDN